MLLFTALNKLPADAKNPADELDKDEYWRSVNSCPRQLKIPPPTIPKAPGARTDAPPKTWQEQAERADAEADARSVDEFSMGDIDF